MNKYIVTGYLGPSKVSYALYRVTDPGITFFEKHFYSIKKL